VPLSVVVRETGRRRVALPESIYGALLGRFGLPRLPPGALEHLGGRHLRRLDQDLEQRHEEGVVDRHPLVVVVHGDTWNPGHEPYLAGDIRIAAANTRFGQDENTHGRFPGGGATVRFVRDAGWGNAMRYMLTGDHWSAEESYRMGITQLIAPTPMEAIDAGIAMARKIAACAPLSIKATLASAHQVIDPEEADALSKLGAQYSALYRTEDFLEGRRAEAEGRPPKYHGK